MGFEKKRSFCNKTTPSEYHLAQSARSCSLGCFKRHKEVPCVKPLSPEKETSPVRELPSDQPLRVDTPDCIIQQAQPLLVTSEKP
ncbi:hypothetical protein MLD38_012388 [Melastoma candidum]|uniref:Uncharacterized protein n=1 Tax=Melastoma candidum TaxID=119954 RepID=A0ACB9R5L8_9MYRT|nr:hypothetical protein MLD38_012388 [Melastoma candidum]